MKSAFPWAWREPMQFIDLTQSRSLPVHYFPIPILLTYWGRGYFCDRSRRDGVNLLFSCWEKLSWTTKLMKCVKITDGYWS